MFDKAFTIVTYPWVVILQALSRFTGHRSTFFVRRGVFLANVATFIAIVEPDNSSISWKLFGLVVLAIISYMGTKVALHIANKTDAAIENGATTLPFTIKEYMDCRLWAILYTVYGVLMTVAWAGGWTIMPLRMLLIGCVATWLVHPNSGGTSAWARLKNCIRTKLVQPVPVKEGV